MSEIIIFCALLEAKAVAQAGVEDLLSITSKKFVQEALNEKLVNTYYEINYLITNLLCLLL